MLGVVHFLKAVTLVLNNPVKQIHNTLRHSVLWQIVVCYKKLKLASLSETVTNALTQNVMKQKLEEAILETKNTHLS